MSVPIAVTGLIPNRKISSGVISVPPPMPVMPTSAPMPKPKMTIAGSMPPCHPHLVLLDFPDHFGWEYGLRQDTSDERLDWRGFALLRRPAHDRGARPRGRAAGRRRLGRPLRLRQVDLAGADLRLAGTRGREDLGRRRDRRRRASRRLRLHAPARPAPALVLGDRQRGAGAAQSRPGPRGGAARRGRAVRPLRPRRLRDEGAGGALRRDAPAGRLLAHAGLRQAGAGARRALRRARRDHAGGDAGVAGGGAARRPPHRRPRHPRRRGGALPGRPRDRPLRPPGADRRRAADTGAACHRPRRGRHRSRLRRRSRAGAAGAARGLAVKRWLYPLALLAALIGLWQIAASSGFMADVLGLEEFLVPSPAEIAAELWERRSLLAENGWVTLVEIVLGFAISVALGVAFATAMHLWTTIRLAAN